MGESLEEILVGDLKKSMTPSEMHELVRRLEHPDAKDPLGGEELLKAIMLKSMMDKGLDASKPVGEEAPEFSESEKIVLNGYFQVEKGTYAILKRNIEKCVNTMLIGPTGTGKTELVSNIAKELGKPITIFDMGTMTDPIMGLVGTHTISVKEGKTYSEFKKSRFSEVIQEPGIVLLDEISRASAAANNLLFPVLDFRKTLSMEYSFDNTDPIQVHPECVFFSTANIGSQYTGTHKLDRALIDRFMTIEVDQLEGDDILNTVKAKYEEIDENKLRKIVNIYNSINKKHDEFELDFNMSIRHLKLICGMVADEFTIYDSYYILCKGLGGKEALKVIEDILNTEL